MQNKNTPHYNSNKKFSTGSSSRNVALDFQKVDINVLLNRVKVNNVKDKKKKFFFIACSILGTALSAFIIFS